MSGSIQVSLGALHRVGPFNVIESTGLLAQGIGMLVMGAVYLALCRGNLSGALWGWYLTVLVAGASVLAGLLDVAQGHALSLWNLVVFGGLLAYYLTSEVRRFFGVPWLGGGGLRPTA